MTDRPDAEKPTSHHDIQFLAEQAGRVERPERVLGGGGVGMEGNEAFMALLTALSSVSARLDQHHDRERAELLASIRR